MRNHTDVLGKDVNGDLLDLMNWPDTIVNTPVWSLSNAFSVKEVFPDLIIWHCTWKDINNRKFLCKIYKSTTTPLFECAQIGNDSFMICKKIWEIYLFVILQWEKKKTKQFDYGISSILEQTHKQIHTKEEPKEWPSFVLSRKKRKKGRSFIIHYSIKFLTIDHHNYLFVSKQKWNDTFVIFMRHIMCDLSFVLV